MPPMPPPSWTHEPVGYVCPICEAFEGRQPQVAAADYVFRGPQVHAAVSPVWWGRCEGQVVVAPNSHVENLYALPRQLGHELFDVTQTIAVAMRESFGCTGVTVRQHNEPDGNQSVWHFHQHIIARWPDDGLDAIDRTTIYPTPGERDHYATLRRDTIHRADSC